MPLNYQSKGERAPVIILGAARSGTKLLRSIVAATGCYTEVPFDVNFIWRYGNDSCPHDALVPEQITNRVKRFVRERLRCCAQLPNGNYSFVEKTVSNTLRPEFCHAIFPDAKFISIVRDGRDVVESAARCWRQPPQVRYLVTKLRTFPWLHCGSYGRKYLAATTSRLLGISSHLRTWGPRYPGIHRDIAHLSLHEVCARQWLASVEHFQRALGAFHDEQLLEIRYEALIRSPIEQVARLCAFLGIDNQRPVVKFARQTIRPPKAVENFQSLQDRHPAAFALIEPALARLGYTQPTCTLIAA